MMVLAISRSLKCQQFRMKLLICNCQFWLMVLVMGGSIGFINGFLTLLQQLMCSRGYPNKFSGT